MTDAGTFTSKSPRPQKRDADEQARAFAIECARLMSDLKCEDLLIFDVRGLSEITDFVVIGTGTSDRQMRSVAEDLEELGQQHSFARYGKEDDEAATWIVADFVEVVAHLFEPGTRAHYDLEMMWGDAPKVAWRRDPSAKPPGEGAS
ncbi:MAG: ribosome silencing factor [Planctomycetota bacterium]